MTQTKEEKLKYRRDWYRRNIESVKEKERIRSRLRNADPEYKKKIADYRLKREYGISLADYNEMLRIQNNVCYICKQNPNPDRKLHTDHCHKTEIVRGLLCARCNWFMAVIDNDPSVLERLTVYKLFKPEKRYEI